MASFSSIKITSEILSTRKRKIKQPVKTTRRKAKLGFCSFIIRARKVATNAIPTIFRISMADLPLSIGIKRRI
jgi:hypothetical protein